MLTSDCAGSSLSSRTRIKTLAYDTILANARFFDNNISAVPRMALTVGVGTVLDSREVVVVVTGQRKSLALSKAIGLLRYLFTLSYAYSSIAEEGVNHLVRHLKTLSFQFVTCESQPAVDALRTSTAFPGTHCSR
jgi:glucosamine-6-phosphate deaminase